MKKITKATFKSFIKNNADRLYVKTLSYFNGMIDGIEYKKSEFTQSEKSDRSEFDIRGVSLVGGDRFTAYDDGIFTGIKVYNCCGSFIVAVRQMTLIQEV